MQILIMKRYILWIFAISASSFLFSCSKDNSAADSGGEYTDTGGSLARFTIYGEYLYTVDHQVLKTYSLADPEKPALISAVNIGWAIETIYPYEGSLFIGSRDAMYIYNLTDPGKPKQAGMVSHVRACDPVVADDDYAYVTVRAGTSCGGMESALLVYDAINPDRMKQIASIPLEEPYGLGIKGNTLYICDGNAGLKVFDVSDPKSPAVLTSRDGYKFRDCIPYNDILVCMVSRGLVIYDISNPNNPVFVAEIIA